MSETERVDFLAWLDSLLDEKDRVLQTIRVAREESMLRKSEIEVQKQTEEQDEEVSLEKPPQPKRTQDDRREVQKILLERYEAVKRGDIAEDEQDPRLAAALAKEVDVIREGTKKRIFETPLDPSEMVTFINAKNRKFEETVRCFEEGL